MRTAQEIYEAYRIMPSLQLHQLRVAAVGKLIADHFSDPLDANSIILACLLHDMGNIIKSDLTTFPDFLEPQGFEYWKKVKDEYAARFDSDEHHATVEIVKEIGLPETVIALVDGVAFSKLEAIRDSGSYEQRIVQYADSRVGPRGILSLRDRQEEAWQRYTNRKYPDMPKSRERFEELARAADDIERQLFEHAAIRPEDINDTSVAPLIDELRKYPVA